MPAQTVLPRWRGFNLLSGFTMRNTCDFPEEHFRWMADWGFDFARLPLCYTLWTNGDDVYSINEAVLEKIDKAVEYGRKHGIHVDISFHRGPGYSVNPERKEPFNLWTDAEALDAFKFHWELFARRYKGVPSEEVSFNLINEPAAIDGNGLTHDTHATVVRAALEAIHAVDPARLVIADGLAWGTESCPELADLDLAQSCRAYAPSGVSHYRAEWAGGQDWPCPTWPHVEHGTTWDRARLMEYYRPWAELASKGIGVHCGEGGTHNHTPHDVTLRWLRDVLEVLTEYGIGYAMWNLVGSFGVLNSGRKDVVYEDFNGLKLDRKMLELLQEF